MMFFGPERGVASEEDLGKRGLQRRRIEHGHVPLVELDAEIALDPREGVLLADGEDHIVAGEEDGFESLRFPGLHVPLEALEVHADKLAVLEDETFWRVIDDDLDAFFLGVFELPRGGFEEIARAARHHLDVFAAEAARGAAAIHGRVADADDQNAFADGIDMAEGDGLEPVDADMDAIGFVAARDIEILAARGTGADEYGVVVLFVVVEQSAQAWDGCVVADVDAHVDDRAAFFIDDAAGQAERGDVRAHEAAGLFGLLEHGDLISERHQIVGHGERCGTRAHARDVLAVLARGNGRQQVSVLALEIGRNAFETADGDGRGVNAGAPADRLTRTVARAPQDGGEHIRLAVEHIRLGVAPLRDEPDVLGDIGVGGAAPLAVDYFVVIIRVLDVGWFHGIGFGYGEPGFGVLKLSIDCMRERGAWQWVVGPGAGVLGRGAGLAGCSGGKSRVWQDQSQVSWDQSRVSWVRVFCVSC